MTDRWERTHTNGWVGSVEKVAAIDRFVAYVRAPKGSASTRAGDFATRQRAQDEADATVQRATSHQCSRCELWH